VGRDADGLRIFCGLKLCFSGLIDQNWIAH
jgi:hypothetical protein